MESFDVLSGVLEPSVVLRDTLYSEVSLPCSLVQIVINGTLDWTLLLPSRKYILGDMEHGDHDQVPLPLQPITEENSFLKTEGEYVRSCEGGYVRFHD